MLRSRIPTPIWRSLTKRARTQDQNPKFSSHFNCIAKHRCDENIEIILLRLLLWCSRTKNYNHFLRLNLFLPLIGSEPSRALFVATMNHCCISRSHRKGKIRHNTTNTIQYDKNVYRFRNDETLAWLTWFPVSIFKCSILSRCIFIRKPFSFVDDRAVRENRAHQLLSSWSKDNFLK